MSHQRYTGLIDHYRSRMPVAANTESVCLGEGNTPLIELKHIPRETGHHVHIYVKYEGLNPTASFKDRGMTMAVTQAKAAGSNAVICASTGNTSASAAAYAVRAGMKAFVLIPDGKIAMGKLAQAIVHGAKVIQVRGNFDDGMRLVKEVADEAGVTIVNSINPYRLQGQKSAAFEIVDELGRAPDFHYLPVGNAGNITAHWLGYCEYAGVDYSRSAVVAKLQEGFEYDRKAVTDSRPVMVGYQAAGAAPFINGAMVDDPDTVATAIRIGHPQSWELAWNVQKESGGWFDALPDEEILKAQKLLSSKEGVFCEPASAASLAGALRDIELGKIPTGSHIVCTLTGHGLKDPSTAMTSWDDTVVTIDATREAVVAELIG